MSNLASRALWPKACPRCHARLNTLDRTLLLMRHGLSVASMFGGPKPNRSDDLRKCSWCDKPNGAPKAPRGAGGRW